MLRANPDSWIHQLVACWRERVDSLVKTDFSSGLLSIPRRWRARFCTFPHEQGHTDSVGFIQSSSVLLSCGNKCGKALSGRKRWDSLESLPSQCALRMPACKPRLSSDTLQNLGSRGKQRLTVLDCSNQRTFFFFSFYLCFTQGESLQVTDSLLLSTFHKNALILPSWNRQREHQVWRGLLTFALEGE